MKRMTKQKQIIAYNMQNRYDHPTPEMVYVSVKQQIPNIGLATVYRNLKSLSEDGKLQKITTKDGNAHYDYNDNGHCHLICSICHKIIDVDVKNICTLRKEYDGFLIENTDIQVHGICNDCQKKRRN